MVKPAQRSRTLRRVYRKTPGGKTKLYFKKRKPKAARCFITKLKLPGVPRERPYKLRKLCKTKRRPERPYGGILSSRALRKLMIKKTRTELSPE